MTIAESLDAVVDERVLIFGSLPPNARDLDLLARPTGHSALAAWLADNGFEERHGEWARFRDCSVESVDLVPARDWNLPSDELDRLFADAYALDGLTHLVAPAPHHDLLMVAVRVSEANHLSDKRRARVERALERDPQAWDAAAERARAWNAEAALATLRSAYEGEPLGPAPRGRGAVVTFSGVDGSGKTTQIEALKETLARLGHETTDEYVRIEWMTLTGNRFLAAAAAPAKRVARMLSPSGGAVAGPSPPSAEEPDAGRRLRERSRLITQLWVLVVALAHARVQRRAARHAKEGTIVVCDRYTLDAVVYLRYRYGEQRRFHLQAALLRLLSPKPTASYLLDVAAEVALSRKHEQFGLEELRRLARLYREECARFDARPVDGTRPHDELCAEIARDVWRRL